ncbi:MAG TPA: PadR family transcriptional regulator [Vicinamibacterales bacterium]|nr:PadR family transcriptional regulator [Vicinamibacterales bacterium]
MRRRPNTRDGDLLGGTLDMLILQTLKTGPAHGFAIAQSVAHRSDEVLLVEEGSLYPALHRLEDRGWISARWGVSENNRRAKFYTITGRGRKQLAAEATRWIQLATAVARVMEPGS